MTWSKALPHLLLKVDEILRTIDLADDQAHAIGQMEDNIAILFRAVREAVYDDDYERLIASTDRLREEIKATDAALDRMLRPNF